MSLLVALWVSILQALAALPAQRPHVAVAAPARTAAESSVLRRDPRPVHHAPRVSRVVVGVVSSTGDAPAPPATLRAPLGPAARVPDAPPVATDAGDRALRVSHAVAALGAVLPYFATAPPLLG